MILIKSAMVKTSDNSEKELKFYHAENGDFIWVDGTAIPSKIRGKETRLPFMGCNSYKNGVFIVGVGMNINYRDEKLLHVNSTTARAFTDQQNGQSYFDSIVKSYA